MDSKLRAYYLNDENLWTTLSRWDLLKMTEVDYRKFKYKYFPSAETDSKLYLLRSVDSPKLTFNKGQKTFRFFPSNSISVINNKGMTLVHLLAQEVISEMKYLNIEIVDKTSKPSEKFIYKINVKNIYIEKQILKGKYRVDLLIHFSEPEELALKWGQYFVIEVYVSNEAKGSEIADFEKISLSLMELNLSSVEKDYKKKNIIDVTEDEEISLKNKLKNYFNKQIYATLLVNASSKSYLESVTIKNYKTQIADLNILIETLQRKHINSIDKLDNLESEMHNIKQGAKLKEITYQREIKKISSELSSLNDRSKMKCLMDLLRK